MMQIEITIEDSAVSCLPIVVEGPNPPDVIRLGNGLLVLSGKPLDGRKAHFTYRIPTVHEAAYLFLTEEPKIRKDL